MKEVILPELEITALVPDQTVRINLNDSLTAVITVKDHLTGEQKSVETTPRIAGMMMALLIGGDEEFKDFYPEIETVFGTDKWPVTLRPIP